MARRRKCKCGANANKYVDKCGGARDGKYGDGAAQQRQRQTAAQTAAAGTANAANGQYDDGLM